MIKPTITYDNDSNLPHITLLPLPGEMKHKEASSCMTSGNAPRIPIPMATLSLSKCWSVLSRRRPTSMNNRVSQTIVTSLNWSTWLTDSHPKTKQCLEYLLAAKWGHVYSDIVIFIHVRISLTTVQSHLLLLGENCTHTLCNYPHSASIVVASNEHSCND
ncbi:hypothetical protein ACHAW6_000218 [Cyclotella cf. meneghiniana]